MKYVVKVKGHKDTPGVVNEGRISMFPQNMKIGTFYFYGSCFLPLPNFMLIMLLVRVILTEQAAPQTACYSSILGLKAQILHLNNASGCIYTCSDSGKGRALVSLWFSFM